MRESQAAWTTALTFEANARHRLTRNGSVGPDAPNGKSRYGFLRRGRKGARPRYRWFDMDNILVTGGAGYIGSHACKLLARSGFRPIAVDDLSRGHKELVRFGRLEIADLRDKPALERIFARYHPAAIIHFAGLAYVGESVEQPFSYYSVNVGATLTLLDVMRAANVRRIVFSSTCATYGALDTVPTAEATMQRPINPYGRSKLMVEQILTDHDAAYGMTSVALRYFNACGADPDGDIGECHDPEPHLIPRALMAAYGDIPYLDVFGSDYPTPDGTCIRDFIHVSDLAKAHLAAVLHLLRGGRPLQLNLGLGRGFSVREVVAAVERVTGRRVPIRYAGRRPGDPPVLVADPTASRALLRFQPEFVDLDQMIGTAHYWYERLRRERRASLESHHGPPSGPDARDRTRRRQSGQPIWLAKAPQSSRPV